MEIGLRGREPVACRIRIFPWALDYGRGGLNWSRCFSRPSDVAMVETAHLRELNNLSHSWWLNGPRLRGVFAQR